MAVTHSVTIGDTTVSVEVLPDGTFRVEGVVYRAVAAGSGIWRIDGPAAASRVWMAGPAGEPWIFHAGHTFRPEVAARGARTRRSRGEMHGALTAPMPATVRAVLVSAGERVSSGDVLVVLEAMKMELPVRAPADGVIAGVRCAPGELVQAGAPLVELA